VACARRLGAPACIYTFDPPPRVVLAPHQHVPRISSWTDRVELLGRAGIDHVVVEHFTRGFAQHPPSWFVDEVLQRRLHPRAMVVGYDFRFGAARAGDLAYLRANLKGVDLDQVSPWSESDLVVSSSKIRDLVLAGEVVAAAGLLGRAHFIRGTVVPGDRRGRTIGFPTANIESDDELLPSAGVYAVRARVDGGPVRAGVANLGFRPTFDGTRLLIEVHLLGFDADLYGKEMEVHFIHRLRDERKFSSKNALIIQIREDVQSGQTLLDAHEPALFPATTG
jgi:riboflavin kinase/FMN adenylyltransferase